MTVLMLALSPIRPCASVLPAEYYLPHDYVIFYNGLRTVGSSVRQVLKMIGTLVG